jgi:hypothetical protein
MKTHFGDTTNLPAKKRRDSKTGFEYNGTSEFSSSTITTHLHTDTLNQPSVLESTTDQKNLLSTLLQTGQLA